MKAYKKASMKPKAKALMKTLIKAFREPGAIAVNVQCCNESTNESFNDNFNATFGNRVALAMARAREDSILAMLQQP